MSHSFQSRKGKRHAGAAHARGVTLIELMVGMAIGLLAVLVMTQVALVYEGHKRSTTSGSDAQVNGALALYTLQRDVEMGGYGLTSAASAIGCPIKGQRAGTPTPAATSMTLAPVIITDGASGAPDSIEVIMSSSSNYSIPIPVKDDHPRDGNQFWLKPNVNLGNSKGDLMLAVPVSIDSTHWCSIFNISADPATTGDRIVHDPGADGPWNQDKTSTVFPGTSDSFISYPSGSYLINLGRLTNRVYSVSSTQTLQVQSFVSDAVSSSQEDLFANVVNLQAVYGKDTNNDQIADTWNVVTPTTSAEWSQVIAVRMAVVTRSIQYEKEEVTTAQPTWRPDGSTATAITVNTLTDWKHYRYKVYELAVPLRNMLWHSR